MGVNSHIYLDPTARLSDVTLVIGILAGLKAEKRFYDGKYATTGPYGARVEGVKAEACSFPELAAITIENGIGGTGRHCYWHWESEPNIAIPNAHMLSPKANPFWIAVGKRLVDFFGGIMVYSDCDGNIDHAANRPRDTNFVQTGKAWADFQDEMLALQPVTLEEYHEANKLSAYTMLDQEIDYMYNEYFNKQKEELV